jgi:hypothetical protein
VRLTNRTPPSNSGLQQTPPSHSLGRRQLKPDTLARHRDMLSGVQLGVWLTVLVACSRAPRGAGTTGAVASSPEAAVVPKSTSEHRLAPAQFHLAVTGSADGSRRYLATTDDAPSCRFELRQGPSQSSGSGLFSVAKLSLHRRGGSDCTEFLRRVAKELSFSGNLPRPAAADELTCSIAILGTNQSRFEEPEIGASFSSTPPGNWTAAKLFLADGEGEVFFNLNERDGVGEFSIKDEDYAALVVNELAKVLLPRAG